MPQMELEQNLDQVAESLVPKPTQGRGGAEDAGRLGRGLTPSNEAVNRNNRASEAEDELPPEGQEASQGEVDPTDLELLEEPPPQDDGEEEDQRYAQQDPDEAEYEVVVDGAPTRATLRELKNSFSGTKAIDTRLQQASEHRRNAEILASNLTQQLQATYERLGQLDQVLAEAENGGVNWDQLRATDPAKYLMEKERQREIQNRRAMLNHQRQIIAQQQEQVNQQQQAQYIQLESEKLRQKIPEFADPVKAQALTENLNKTARYYGYSDQEIGSIIDHRHVTVLRDAMKYRALVAAKQARTKGLPRNQQQVQPKALLRPGTANFGQRMNNVKAEREAASRAAQTGNIDDVAASLLVSGRSRQAPKRTGF